MYTEPNMKFNLAAMKKHHEICQNFLDEWMVRWTT